MSAIPRTARHTKLKTVNSNGELRTCKLPRIIHMNPAPRTLLTGLAFGESPRWHDGRLWFANWGTQQIVAANPAGKSEVIATVPTTLPFSIDWLPDGEMLIVSGPESLILRLEPDGALVEHADLKPFGSLWNEIVIDGRGNTYVNGAALVLITPEGAVRKLAEDFAFPNGMAITPDNTTLIVAESHARRLTAFDIAADGSLANRRVWADLRDGVPDGICVDVENAVWYADVPNKRCVRVREGGEVLETINLDRGCFACMLGGSDRKTLFIVAAEWLGFERIAEALAARTGRLLAAEVSVPAAGWP
jgi:sugar lactone lactonase YvrE